MSWTSQLQVMLILSRLSKAGPTVKYRFGNIDEILRAKRELAQAAKTKSAEKPKKLEGNAKKPVHQGNPMKKAVQPAKSATAQPTLDATDAERDFKPSSTPKESLPKNDLLARRMNQLSLSDSTSVRSADQPLQGQNDSDSKAEDHNSGVDASSLPKSFPAEVDHGDMAALLSDSSDGQDSGDEVTDEYNAEIRHAPLLDEDFIFDNSKNLVPQYGLIGSHSEFEDGKSKLFLNTNTPFSAFICGVQGSGKSHTTSCIMENALISSKNLGKLANPLSALVFSYGHFSGDGSGYSISEAAFLAAPHPKLPGGAHIKKVNVLVSPSNFVRISKLYLRIPNVTVSCFKLKPWNLDIDIMLTLMNVNESGEAPLYMAQVTQILREMAASGSSFNYDAFKLAIKQQNFNPAQNNMLQMRLNLLESFLDLDNTCAEPSFAPGEITIMDMSCPFIDPNTACILFRIGLQRYLQSDASGKMIVLDEAHKVSSIR